MERQWYYIDKGQQKGPISQDQLLALLQQGILQRTTPIWTDGMPDWQPASNVEITTSIFQAQGRRPTSVTVFGILNIVFGGLTILCSPVGIFVLMMPQPQTVVLPASIRFFSFISYGLGFLIAFVLLASGIGLLRLRKWARQVTYLYGWFTIIWAIVSTAISILLYALTLDRGEPQMSPVAIQGIVGSFCGGIVGLVYPIFIIVYMRKPHVIEACCK